jgi:membrane-associated phospholipid phosphatase
MTQRTRWAAAILLAIGAMAAATALDRWAYQVLVIPDVYGRDWGRMFRVAGYLPTWAVVSLALVLCDTGAARAPIVRVRRWRGWLPLLSATLGGCAAELLKLLFRRERPEAHDGAYVFRSWSDHPLSTGALGLPSSHALVAFAAAAILARLYPRARWLWYALAGGCALTRVLTRAHFLSDVVLAAIAGWAVAAGLWRWYARGVPAATGPP